MRKLPEGWIWRRLTDLVDFPQGQVSPIGPPYSSYVLVGPDHIESGTGRLLEKKTAREQGAISGKYLIEPGDVVYSKIRPVLRKAIKVDFRGLCSADMYPMKVKPQVEPRFLLAVLLSDRFTRFAESRSGRSGIPKVNRKELEEFFFPLPSLGEQRQIAEVFSALDDRISCTKKLLEKRESIATALARSLIPVQPEPCTVGPGWGLVPLSEVVPSADYGISTPLVLEGDGLPTLRMNNLANGRIVTDEIKRAADPVPRHLVLQYGDVLFNRTNSAEHVGRTAMWRSELDSATFASYLVRLNLDLSRLMPGYLVRWLNHPAIQQRVRCLATPGVHQVNINPTNLRKTLLELPLDLSLQVRIIDILDACDRLADGLRFELKRLEVLRRGLTNDLLVGRVCVALS